MGGIWGFAGRKPQPKFRGIKRLPGAPEAPHSFQGWGLFSRPARPPASPALWNGSLQRNSTRTSGRGSPCFHLTVCTIVLYELIQRGAGSSSMFGQPEFSQFDTTVQAQGGGFMPCLLKSPPRILDSSQRSFGSQHWRMLTHSASRNM